MKNKALKVINPILLILLLVTMIAMLFYMYGNESGTMLAIHKWSGMLFFLLGVIHLFFNWSWMRSNIFKKKK